MAIKFILYVCIIACTLIPLCTTSSLSQEKNGAVNYSRAQLKFMMRNGFDPEQYNWQNKEVNLLLDGAMSSKSGSGGLIGLGVVTFGVSTSIAFLGSLTLIGSQAPASAHRAEKRLQKIFNFGVSTMVVATTWALIKRGIARKKIDKARTLVRPHNINPHRQGFNDFFQKDGK